MQRFEGSPWLILSHFSVVLGSAWQSLRGIYGVVLNLFVVPVVTFYFLRDSDTVFWRDVLGFYRAF